MPTAETAARPRVLVVEDDFLIRLSLSESLIDHGIEVVEAGTAAEAMTALESDPAIGVLLTDIRLPGGMDGWQLARAVRALRPGLPIVFMTGRPISAADPAPSPIDVFVAKPYLPSAVAGIVHQLVTKA